MTGEITFDREKTKALRRAYEKAQQAGKERYDTFEFEGHELVMDYAKYVLEYLEAKFPQ